MSSRSLRPGTLMSAPSRAISLLRYRSPLRSRVLLSAVVLAPSLTGCLVGPAFVKPTPAAPDSWTSWRSADTSLTLSGNVGESPRADWWRAFNDPVLDSLVRRALTASPDLRTAALHLAAARVQRGVAMAERAPQVGLSAAGTQQRQSEYGAGTRLLDGLGGDRSKLATLLSDPFTLYQAGFDASWELDLWGRTRRALEAADADVGQQTALLELTWLGLASDVGRNYSELRTAQRQAQLLREDIAAAEARLRLTEARVQGGLLNHIVLEQQRAELAAIRAQLPGLIVQEGMNANQITSLLGEHPGALQRLLAAPTSDEVQEPLPDLTLGLPSAVAMRRPDIRAAEARLRKATAGIGIAQAALYPSIRLGTRAGFESYLGGEFADWGTRVWAVGPSLNLPVFDRGRRRRVVQLRELEQQEAAVKYQQAVLRAWQEIDEALTTYSAEQQQGALFTARETSALRAYELAQAQYAGGLIDFGVVLERQRGYLQARRDLTASRGRLQVRYVMINKALGVVPESRDTAGDVEAH